MQSIIFTRTVAKAAGALFCCLLLSYCEFKASSAEYLYTDPQYRFRLAIPNSGWTLTDETGIPEVLVIIKSEKIAEDFIPNVTVSVELLPGMMSAEEYGENNLRILAAQGCEILSQEMTMINQNKFYDLQCIIQNVSPPLRFRYSCIVKNQIGFIITCTAPNKAYGTFHDDFEFIVNSYQFI